MLVSFARVRGMSEQHNEPGEITERFRAFAQSQDPQPRGIGPGVLIGIGALVLLALVLVVWLAMS